MITSALIENFKGIKKCKIEGLSRINLFVGVNDSCKSTIMEAIYTTLKEFAQPSLSNVISRRSNVTFGGREIWYNYDVDKKILSQIKFGNGVVSMTVGYNKTDNQITSHLEIDYRTRSGGAKMSGPSSYYHGRDWSLRQTIQSTKYLDAFPIPEKVAFQSYISNSIFIDSSSRNDLQYIEKLLGMIKLEGKDKEFGMYVSDVFGKGKNWEFVPHPDFPSQFRAAFQENDVLVFLNALGDGIRFAMLIIANAILTKNAAIFVEEIENNQHPGSLRKIVPLLVDLSKKSNLQVFITTHNPSVWSLFEIEFEKPKDRNDNFRCFHVIRDNKTGIVDCVPQTKENSDEFFSSVHEDLYR